MNFLLLNQTFHPDVVSTAQHLSDLAVALVARGHGVTVLTGRHAYDDPRNRFPKEETWRGVQILRVGGTRFGKSRRWRRAADFASFLALAALRLCRVPRHEVVLALTSPPLIAVLGALTAWRRHSRFVYWVMDLNPDEAVAAGWLAEGSAVTRSLERLSRFALNRAQRIIVLDRFMRDRLLAKGIAREKLAVIAPWSHDPEVSFDPVGRERFREDHGLQGKFVVMYSGNHSPCHPLDTLLEAARRLVSERNMVFCFVGGGSEFQRVQARLSSPGPERSNIRCLPYQPLAGLSASLSAADLHVVVMGEAFVGLVHPCKVYNILNVGAPVLYIGPVPSPTSETLASLNGQQVWGRAEPGDVDGVVALIHRIRGLRERVRSGGHGTAPVHFSKAAVLPRFLDELECAGGGAPPI